MSEISRGYSNLLSSCGRFFQECEKTNASLSEFSNKGDSEGGIVGRRAERMKHFWLLDFVFARTANGRPLKILSIIDKYTRECIALEVSRRLVSEDVISMLTDLFAIRGVTGFLRSDNRPEFIFKRLQSFPQKIDVGTSYIEPGSPSENGYVESPRFPQPTA